MEPDEASLMLNLFEDAVGSPDGASRLLEQRAKCIAQGRLVAAHAWTDLFVSACIQHNVRLNEAEAFARLLVSELPDKRHWGFLRAVLELRGAREAADDAARQESLAANLHPRHGTAEERAEDLRAAQAAVARREVGEGD